MGMPTKKVTFGRCEARVAVSGLDGLFSFHVSSARRVYRSSDGRRLYLCVQEGCPDHVGRAPSALWCCHDGIALLHGPASREGLEEGMPVGHGEQKHVRAHKHEYVRKFFREGSRTLFCLPLSFTLQSRSAVSACQCTARESGDRVRAMP